MILDQWEPEKAFEISQLVDFKRARCVIVIAVFCLYSFYLCIVAPFTGSVLVIDRQSVECKRCMDYGNVFRLPTYPLLDQYGNISC